MIYIYIFIYLTSRQPVNLRPVHTSAGSLLHPVCHCLSEAWSRGPPKETHNDKGGESGQVDYGPQCQARRQKLPLPRPLPVTKMGWCSRASVVACMQNTSPVVDSKMLVMVQTRRLTESLRYLMCRTMLSVSISARRCTGIVRLSRLTPTSQW